jgi:hypothetical protein
VLLAIAISSPESGGGAGCGSAFAVGSGVGGTPLVGGSSYDFLPPSQTSSVGLPSAEKKRNSWTP